MNIGQAARVSGVSAKLIRYYDSIHLLRPASRNAAGYRVYGQQDAHMLRLIGCARRVGFTIGQIQRLLGLWQDADRTSDEVKTLAPEHINTLNGRLEELRAMRLPEAPGPALRRRQTTSITRHCETEWRGEGSMLSGIAPPPVDPWLTRDNHHARHRITG